MFLTQRDLVDNVDPTDLIHIVKTGDTSQGNPAGSSYKAEISQIFELTADCCLTSGTYQNGTLTFLNLSNVTAFTIPGLEFTGGSDNCINDLYVNNVHPCNFNINVQPNSVGKAFFGAFSGASGFTVDLVTETLTEAARIGLNTNTPEYTFDFYSYDRRSRFYYDDKSIPNLYQIVISGSSDIVPVFGAFTQGSVGLSLGIRGPENTTYDKVGDQGDTCLFSTTDSKGLNIITQIRNDGQTSPDYIRFYAGTSVSDASNKPHIHIDGDGTNRGFIGIGSGNTDPTSLVDISGVTGSNLLRLRTAYIPTSTNDPNGEVGQICWGVDGQTPYIYLKTPNGWIRQGLNGF